VSTSRTVRHANQSAHTTRGYGIISIQSKPYQMVYETGLSRDRYRIDRQRRFATLHQIGAAMQVYRIPEKNTVELRKLPLLYRFSYSSSNSNNHTLRTNTSLSSTMMPGCISPIPSINMSISSPLSYLS